MLIHKNKFLEYSNFTVINRIIGRNRESIKIGFIKNVFSMQFLQLYCILLNKHKHVDLLSRQIRKKNWQ